MTKQQALADFDKTFNTLREMEGISKGKISDLVGIECETAILFNRRFKKEHGIELSDLERIIADEAGYFIRCYITDTFQKPIFQNLTSLPYPRYDITMDQVLEVFSVYDNEELGVGRSLQPETIV